MTSKIKVDNINKVSDDSNIINKCGTSITVGANGDTVIIPNGVTEQVQSGGDIQVQSGGQVTIASGATITNNGTATGFGATGAVNWDTTPKTTTFTAETTKGYFVDTSAGVITANLPVGSAGAIIAFADYTRTFATHNLTISPNGSEKIGGIAADATLDVAGQAATFVYVDGTEGWVAIQDSTGTTGTGYIVATGGTITECGNYRLHTFTGPGTFCVSGLASAPANNVADYLVVGGGGAGRGGGGGAGGVRFYASPDITTYPASPRNGPAQLPISIQGYSIAVGAGGVAPNPWGTAAGFGVDSTFSTITSTGGAQGGNNDGGSGGGGHEGSPGAGSAGSGNTPPTSPSQGEPGGSGPNPGQWSSAGGGGFLNAGSPSPSGSWTRGGNGGDGGGFPTTFVGSNGEASSCKQYFGGGGGGQSYGYPSAGTGGTGGGGPGGRVDGGGPSPGPTFPAGTGDANTGGGGGGTYNCGVNGGSGIVIIRYKYQ